MTVRWAGPVRRSGCKVRSRDFLRLEAAGFLTECSSHSPAARSSLFRLAFVLILSSMSLPNIALKRPVDRTKFSRGLTATGLLSKKDKEPAFR